MLFVFSVAIVATGEIWRFLDFSTRYPHVVWNIITFGFMSALGQVSIIYSLCITIVYSSLAYFKAFLIAFRRQVLITKKIRAISISVSSGVLNKTLLSPILQHIFILREKLLKMKLSSK